MITEKCKITSRHDEIQISCLICRPEDPECYKGIVQISHGMCEYKERYLPFMDFLCSHGYICVISDHRGHGNSIRTMDDLGYFHTGGAEGVVDDLLSVNKMIRERHPELPLILFGHSMGSLAVRSFTKRYDDQIDGLIVCGSPSRNPAAGAGKMLSKLIGAFKGDRHRPAIIQKIAFESFNKRFEAEGHNAWLSNDKAVVAAYNSDPLCTFQFTVNGFTGLFDLMIDTYSDKGWKVSRPELPIHYIAGEDDPCISSLKDFNAAVSHMKSIGYTDITSKTYEGMRHEILNEIRKETVWNDILGVLQAI